MKYLAAYLLLQQGGNASPSAADIKTLLESVGSEVNQENIDLLLTSLEGKSVNDLIAEGATKLASISTGGAAAASSGAAAGGAAEAAAEEEVEEAKEESDDDMGFGLFD
ncbi:60S acidic ribosomal protein P2 [Pichia californica]|uniref:60S acidic ribosomal protein P2 n=1 Tax=Pichia californica TaxID=460514 RepID=A0A9P7BFI8_9ASCO|nr:60S acidic ribosomal protein P2 [[Candida] californica]KAG0688160.1 60S acidic ribosomal protein P2 [[Candida] californica]